MAHEAKLTSSEDGPRAAPTRSQKQFIGFILVLAVVNVAYRLVYASGSAHTAALYVGIPALLAIGLAFLPRSRSATGMIMRGSMLAVLVACVVLPEGLLCLLFVVPLVGLISLVVGGAIDVARRHNRGQGPTLMVLALPLALMSMEGVAGSPINTHDTASASTTVRATPSEIRRALATTPTFERALPPFLAIGFNRPVGATGAGIEVGDERMIDFTGGTHDDHPLRLWGVTGHRSMEHHAHMRLAVIVSEPGRVVFRIDEDTTMLARWAHLERAVVTWEPTGPRTTRVSWRLEYDRLIYPGAYFAPLERYGMGQAASYLLGAAVEHQLVVPPGHDIVRTP